MICTSLEQMLRLVWMRRFFRLGKTNLLLPLSPKRQIWWNNMPLRYSTKWSLVAGSVCSAQRDEFQTEQNLKRERTESEAIYLPRKTLSLRLPWEIKIMVTAIAPLLLWLYEYNPFHPCGSTVAQHSNALEGVISQCTMWTINIVCVSIVSFSSTLRFYLYVVHFHFSSLIGILYVGCVFSCRMPSK